MFRNLPFPAVALLATLAFGLPTAPAHAQDAEYQDATVEAGEPFSTQELDQILAPIALYPDELLSNVLMAATYPLEVVDAARWIDEPEHEKLKGEALERALANEDWDPSVKSLTQFPDVLASMSENLDWMRKLGDAVLADQTAVMDRIQFLRTKAEDAGHLESNERQRITTRREEDRDYIYIEPAERDVVYVPVYEPDVVYGDWWYPDYPPYYWSPVGATFVDYYYWGPAVSIVPTLWYWSRPRWHRHYIHVDRHRFNRLSRHKLRAGHNRWRHNALHRRGVKYHNRKLGRRFNRQSIKGAHALKLRSPGAHRPNRKVKAGKGHWPKTYQRNLHNPKFKGRSKPHRKVHNGKPKGMKPGNAPGVKKRPPQKAFSSGPKKPGGKKFKNSPNKKNIKKGPNKKPSAKRAPGNKKKGSGAKKGKKKEKSSGPRKGKKKSAGPRKGKKKAGVKRGGRKAGAKRGGRKAGARKGGHRKGGGGKKGGKGKGKKKK